MPEHKDRQKTLKSIVADLMAQAERFDEHNDDKKDFADNFIDLLYIETINALNFKKSENQENPFGSYNTQPLVKKVNELLVALDLSKNEKLIKKLYKFYRYLGQDSQLNPLLTKHKLEKVAESFHLHLNRNTGEFGKTMLTTQQEFWKWARATMRYLEAEKKDIMKGMPKEQPESAEEESA